MKRIALTKLNVEELLERYVQIGVQQDEALLDLNTRRFNHLYDRKSEIANELRARGNEARLCLLRLYDHPNAQVRLNAIKETLAVAPRRARKALKELADSVEYPQAGDAGMTLEALDDGTFKPT